MKRCHWARTPPNIAYHDEEWGVPVHDDRLLFEFLILEGAQAGLSWETILKKRANYRLAFDNFAAATVARYDAARVARLLLDPGIVRNRLKVAAAVQNAKAALQVQAEFGSLDSFLWQFQPQARRPAPKAATDIPTHSAESDAMSKALLSRGFKFVGSTICYAFMQAVGIVNDHTVECFRRREIEQVQGGRKISSRTK